MCKRGGGGGGGGGGGVHLIIVKTTSVHVRCVVQTLRGVFSFIAMYSWRSETDIIRLIREKSV